MADPRPRSRRATLTKARLVDQIRESTGLPKADALALLEGMLDVVKEALELGETVKISGFGSFVVRTKRARVGRNPHTGEALELTGRRVLTFKPSRLLRDAMKPGEPG